MKIVLAALNAKYIHVNLAVRSIGKYCKEFNPVIKEYTINDNIDNIIKQIDKQNQDLECQAKQRLTSQSLLIAENKLRQLT